MDGEHCDRGAALPGVWPVPHSVSGRERRILVEAPLPERPNPVIGGPRPAHML